MTDAELGFRSRQTHVLFSEECSSVALPHEPWNGAEAPKRIGGSYGARVEIAAVAALLRNDMSGVFLSDTGREAARRLGMTGQYESAIRERSMNQR